MQNVEQSIISNHVHAHLVSLETVLLSVFEVSFMEILVELFFSNKLQ